MMKMTKRPHLPLLFFSFVLAFSLFGCEKQVKTAKVDTPPKQDETFSDVNISVKSGSAKERAYEQRLEMEVQRQVGMQVKNEQQRIEEEKKDLQLEKDKLNLKELEKEARPIPDEARKFYQAGIKAFRNGDYYNAAKSFKRITAKHPHSPIAQLSLLKLGEIFFNQGNYVDSRFYSELLIDKYPNSIVANEASYLLGKSYYYLNEYGKAIYHLVGVLPKLKDKEVQNGAIYYFSLAQAETGNLYAALSNFTTLHKTPGISKDIKEDMEDAISDLAAKKMSFEDLKLLQYRFPRGFTDAAIKGALITQHYDKLSPKDQELLVLRYLLDYPAGRDAVMVKVVRSKVAGGSEIQLVSREPERKRFRAKKKEVKKEELKKEETEKIIAGSEVEVLQQKFKPNEIIKIGCVLPLTGRYADFASKVQQGIQLAEGSMKKIKIVYKDSGDNEKNLFTVTRELVEDEKVAGIIGPLLSKSAYTIARLAETPFIPIITPTASDKGLMEKSKVLFSNALTGSEEGKYMAEYIISKTGKGRYITFRAKDSYSMSAEESFRETVEKRGGSVIDSVTVKSKQNDYTKQIIMTGGVHKDDIARALEGEKILKMRAEQARREHQPGKNDLLVAGASGYIMTEVVVTAEEQKIINYFDGVYIAAHNIEAASLASQLRFMNIDSQLLGNSKWRGKDFFKASGTYAKGAIITDDFYNNSGNRKSLKFQKDFHTYYGEDPDKYAASGYSALTIMKAAYDQALHDNVGLITALHRVRDYATITGDVHFDKNGNISKRLLLLEVRGETFRQVR